MDFSLAGDIDSYRFDTGDGVEIEAVSKPPTWTIRIPIVFLFLITASMVCATAFAQSEDPNEPNNTAETATEISYGFESDDAAINPEGDVDYYSFEAQVGDVVKIEVSYDEDSELDGKIWFYDSTGTVLAVVDEVGPVTESIFFVIDREATYFIRYAYWENDLGFPNKAGRGSLTPDEAGPQKTAEDSTGTYTLRLSHITIDADGNNTAGTATAISYGDSVSAAINPEGDVDYYSFEAQAGDLVEIEVSNDPGSALDGKIWFYDSNGMLLGEDDQIHPTTEAVIFEITTTATYFIRYAFWTNDLGFPNKAGRGSLTRDEAGPQRTAQQKTGLYTLRLSKNNIEADGNDTKDTATEISYGASLGAAINPPGDVDYYSFVGQAGDLVEIETNNVPGSNLDGRLWLYDNSGFLVAENNDFVNTTRSRIRIPLFSAGVYFIRYAYYLNDGDFPNKAGRGSPSLIPDEAGPRGNSESRFWRNPALGKNQRTASGQGTAQNPTGAYTLILSQVQIESPVMKQDSMALVVLYNRTNGDEWYDNTNWLRGPVSFWRGVEVTDRRDTDNRVTMLRLPNNQLVGAIPKVLGTLKNLEVLDLGSNQLTGAIPTELGTLENLKTLFLQHNELTGAIPTALGNLVKLEMLNLQHNELTGAIPTALGTLINLKVLDLRANQLTGTIPTALSTLINLEVLDLRVNQLTGAFPTALGTLKNLNTLFLGTNQFDTLPDLSSIGLTSLNLLSVENNRLTFEDIVPNIDGLEVFFYSPQAKLDTARTIMLSIGEDTTLSISVGGAQNHYQWFKNDEPIPEATDSTYVLTKETNTDDEYVLEIINGSAPELTLESEPITIGGGPKVTRLDVADATVNKVSSIQATVVDGSGIERAEGRFRRGGDATFFLVPMDLNPTATANTYKFDIPEFAVGDRGIEYFITATDSAGFTTRLPPSGIFSLRVMVPDGVTKNEEQPSNTYRLISVPLDLVDKQPGAMLEDDLGPYNNTQWRFYVPNYTEGGDDSFASEFPNGTMEPGRAFWLIVKEGNKTIDTGSGTTVRTNTPFSIPLTSGWNAIGNPFNFDIPVSNLRLSDGSIPDIRFFDGAWMNLTDTTAIKPFEGYAVFSQGSDTLSIAPNKFTLAQIDTAQQNAPTVAEEAAWSIRILAQSRQAHDIDNVAAVFENASEKWDRMDRPEPPPIGDYVSVYFTHPEWRKATARYSTDARPALKGGAVWPFEVTTTVRDRVHLTFEGLADIPPAFEVWLVDDVVQTAQNLRETPSYTVAATTDPRSLKLVVGKSGFLEGELAESRELPTRFELFANFPNPFNPSTTIRYGLPEASPVSLVIYNVLGRKVATLEASAEKEAGYHAVVWDGRSDAGAPVASGVYFARMRAGRFMQTQQMILAK